MSWWSDIDVLRGVAIGLRYAAIFLSLLAVASVVSALRVTNRIDDLVAVRNAPRILNDAERRAMLSKLNSARYSASVAATATDVETESLTNQLAEVFASAGWEINPGTLDRDRTQSAPGVIVRSENTSALLSAAEALDAARLSYAAQYESPTTTVDIEIIVGPKP